MRQCPVCGSKTYDEPVCVVCGFDISCDYGRLPTLGADIPRDLKARALQKVEGVKNKNKKRPEPTPKPADVPPVSVFSQAEISKLTFRKGLYAFLFSIVAMFFMAFLMMSFDSIAASESGSPSAPPNGVVIGIVITGGLLVFLFAQLKKTLKKMKPDEWVWKKENNGQWIVFPKGKAGTGRKKKMLVSLLLFNCLGWGFGTHAFYEGHYILGGLHLALILFVAASLGQLASKIYIILLLLLYFYDLARIMGMAPEFDKGEF